MTGMRSLAVLYVEDYKLTLLYVQEMLEAQGWRVETCRDGTSALEKIESGSLYDVLLLDSSLPGMNGLELVRRARRLTHRRRTPIIVLLASGSGRSAIQAGADVVLQKPDDVNRIIETITRLVGMR
jgi:CheY-like chemotaxis protein